MDKFNLINNKPKLVDNKILFQIKQNKINKDINYDKFYNFITNFLYNNIGFIIFFIFLICTLSFRYYEVKKRKQNMNNYYDNTYI